MLRSFLGALTAPFWGTAAAPDQAPSRAPRVDSDATGANDSRAPTSKRKRGGDGQAQRAKRKKEEAPADAATAGKRRKGQGEGKRPQGQARAKAAARGKAAKSAAAPKGRAKTSAGAACPVTKAEFLAVACEQTLRLTAVPKALGAGFGWSKAGGRAAVPLSHGQKRTVTCSGPTLNVLVRGSKDGKCGLSLAQFLAAAKPREFELPCRPFEFSTGSLGWMGHVQQLDVVVDGVTLRAQANLNAPIVGSKSAAAGGSVTPCSAAARAAAARIDYETLGRAPRGVSDDLTRIKGIGPFIQERLQGIGIRTFGQIAAMTPAIEVDVNVAIEYFPGRVRRDCWAEQARPLARRRR